ncbi:MAG: YciI family protein [Solirubrobacteraceae bacterium]
MKYALLIYTKPGDTNGFSDGELQSMSAEYYALRDEPTCVDGGHLEDVATATTVRVNGGQTVTTDGPFAETKEVFGGYYVFELDNLDAAIEMASRVPAARLGGSVEVRPIMGE